MNITELARRLKVPTEELKEKLPELGFDIGKRAIQVDDRVANQVVQKWKQYQKQLELEQKAAEREAKVKKQDDNENKEYKAEISVADKITVHDLAEKMDMPVTKVIKELMKNGIVASINESIDYDTAAIIAEDMEYQVTKLDEEDIEATQEQLKRQKLEKIVEEDENNQQRPPVIVVMGHVDHGKTSLLDKIRETKVVDTESGGITQHIGAYQVEKNNKLISFIDTPGHQAFKSMRVRGGLVADIAILIVAADDHVQPQTIESLKIIQEEGLPFVVAINKTDKEEADIDRIKTELTEVNVTPEDWGGETICVPISAKTGKGIDELLEMLLLVGDMHKNDLVANPNREAAGTIIESRVNDKSGSIATVMIHTGTLRAGDNIIVGNTYGKIKSMTDWQGNQIEEAGPSTPVSFLGFKDAPKVGDVLEVIKDNKEFKKKIREFKNKKSKKNIDHQESGNEGKETTLNIIIRSDVLGTLEALVQAICEIKSDDAKVVVAKRGLGDITEADILQAEAIGGVVVGFHVKPNQSAKIMAQNKGVNVQEFSIIYELIDFLKEELSKRLKTEIIRTDLGRVKVLAIFRTEKDSMIIGGKVLDGIIKNDTHVEISRDGKLLDTGKISQLRSGKLEVDKLTKDEECGMKYIGKPIIEEGDILNVYQEEEQQKTLD